MKITKWRPDTCDCEIDYEWDETVPQEVRAHVAVGSKPCAAHAHLDGHGSHFDVVLGENQTKNKLHGDIVDAVGEGDTEKKLGQGKDVEFFYDEARTLHVRLIGFAPGEKKQVEAAAVKHRAVIDG